MTHVSADAAATSPDFKGVQFVDISRRVRLQQVTESLAWVTIRPGPFGPSIRGQLRNRIEDEVERQLSHRGAGAPGISSGADFVTTLRDQVFRAELVGVRGLVFYLDSLFGIVGPSGAIGDDDSSVLRALCEATQQLPLAVWLSPADASIPAYQAPRPLHEIVAAQTVRTAPISSSDKQLKPSIQPVTQPAPPKNAARVASWHQLARELSDAEGPKPLKEVERLFESHYVPLSLMRARGQAGSSASSALARFSASFESSYKDAFSALRVTGKRPLMTVDVPDLATKLARLHGARSTTLLLVDSLRYDLGLLLEPMLVDRLKGIAVLAERRMLWAALPTTTPVQLRLIAKGPRGLGQAGQRALRDGPELVVPRGKNASLIRRMRLSGRELYKLDVVRADLSGHGPALADRLEQLAASIVEPVDRFTRNLPPRSLLLLFGDHGFVLDSQGAGTGPGTSGGASPEQVLVPALGWLVGNVH